MLVLITCMTELSFLFMTTWLFSLVLVISKKARAYFPSQLYIVCLSFLLFPVGLVFIKADPRYIWYMLPLSMLIGAIALRPLFALVNNKKISFLITAFFVVSYICYPVFELSKMLNEGKSEYQIAQQLKQAHIEGSFTSNADYGLATQRVERLGYFSGMSYYNIPFKDISSKQLLREMRRYHVAYYFYYASPQDIDGYKFCDEAGSALPELTAVKINGLKIFKLY